MVTVTVAELIKALEKLPREMLVFHYDNDTEDRIPVREVKREDGRAVLHDGGYCDRERIPPEWVKP